MFQRNVTLFSHINICQIAISSEKKMVEKKYEPIKNKINTHTHKYTQHVNR